jgi:hypothetical protein
MRAAGSASINDHKMRRRWAMIVINPMTAIAIVKGSQAVPSGTVVKRAASAIRFVNVSDGGCETDVVRPIPDRSSNVVAATSDRTTVSLSRSSGNLIPTSMPAEATASAIAIMQELFMTIPFMTGFAANHLSLDHAIFQ